MLETMGWISIVPVALAVILAVTTRNTILSSMGAASDHIDHVKTQLPYALTVAGLCAVTYLIFGIVVA
ncbi:TPA: Na+/H+ antiporter NhaC family protein [Streptococcus suis]